MIRLTDSQMLMLKELESIAKDSNGKLDEGTIECYDENTVELFFRNKILVRIPGRPRDPASYKLDWSVVIRTDDPEELKKQTEEIQLDILLMCAVDVGRTGLERLKAAVKKSLEEQPA